MNEVSNILQDLWDNLFSILPSDITIFLISILGIIIAVALFRVFLGG